MRSWIADFKRNLPAAAGPPARASDSPAPADAGAVDWPQRLQSALGNDDALLALARERAPLDVKLAAVAALASEAALKLAESEFREHDRRVHRLAKQRYGRAVAQRETHARAAAVIEAAQALSREAVIPVNHLVDLDHAWQALDVGLIEAAQRAEFEGLMTRMAALARERADQPLRLRRWSEQARAALAALRNACTEAAAGALDRSQLAAAGAAATATAQAAPPDAAGSKLLDELARAEELRARLDHHLAVLDEVLGLAPPALAAPTAGAPSEPAGAVADAENGTSSDLTTDPPPDASRARGSDARQQALRQWTELGPLGDAPLDERLQQRFADWQQARADAQAARRTQRREEARGRQRAMRDEHAQVLAAAVQAAETALDAGHLAQTHAHLVEIDRLLDGGSSAGAQRGRIDTLQARYAQLKGWQHWAGGRARDELVQQAEALAVTAAGAPGARTAKLTTRQLAEVIDDMRARWKELDRLGGATSRSLWQRFDAALKKAYEPVAAQVAAQRTARDQNLQARQQLLDALEAVPLPANTEGTDPPDWRPLAAAIDHFHTAWRRLGPVEHTVPHKARERLVERMGAALQRLESPLQDARRGARLEREELVARARALQDDAQGRDLVGKVRELQALWQQHARAQPLARADEGALWADFKGAIDAAFGARDAAFKARDAESRAHAAERAALIERLEALTADTPAAQLKRTLAEVDAQWQRAGWAPRNDAAALDARMRQARERVRGWLAQGVQRQWHVTCDALLAKLALCDERERSAEPAATKEALAERWSGLPVLPAPLESALAQRAGLPAPTGRAGAPAVAAPSDELLLQLEAAWGLESPPAFEAARRDLKLRAMKAALETRRPASPAVAAGATPVQWLAELLRRPAPEASQRERLDAVLSALRRRGSLDAG